MKLLSEGVGQAKDYADKLADPIFLLDEWAGNLRHRHAVGKGGGDSRVSRPQTNFGP